MNFFQRRHYRKLVRHLLHEAKHAMHMREDVAQAAAYAEVQAAADALNQAWQNLAGAGELDAACERLDDAVSGIYPPRNHPRIRENVEIFVVAIAVAMAFRAYFIQPFKIPTGSMQPTLNGITVDHTAEKQWYDRFPMSLVGLALFGERYVDVVAKDSGTIHYVGERPEDSQLVFAINGKPHVIHRAMKFYFDPMGPAPRVNKGDRLASGRRQMGDHIFVNRVKYNFIRPDRGDVFVFSTRAIVHEQIRPDAFYIKRIAGIPNERISIDPPYLLSNGERVTTPSIFETLATDPRYDGYVLVNGSPPMARITSRQAGIQLGDGEYLAFGDNTKASLDSRYFGAVNETEIIGPAFLVYWPFTKRWGLIN